MFSGYLKVLVARHEGGSGCMRKFNFYMKLKLVVSSKTRSAWWSCDTDAVAAICLGYDWSKLEIIRNWIENNRKNSESQSNYSQVITNNNETNVNNSTGAPKCTEQKHQADKHKRHTKQHLHAVVMDESLACERATMSFIHYLQLPPYAPIFSARKVGAFWKLCMKCILWMRVLVKITTCAAHKSAWHIAQILNVHWIYTARPFDGTWLLFTLSFMKYPYIQVIYVSDSVEHIFLGA